MKVEFVEFVEFGRGKAPHAYFDLSLTVSNKLKLNLMNYFQRGRKLKWLSFFYYLQWIPTQ